MKIFSLYKQKHGYLIHTWSDKALKGTVVNWAFFLLHGGSLKHYTYSPFQCTVQQQKVDKTFL